jgi:uncharacterized protein (DUF433 family)
MLLTPTDYKYVFLSDRGVAMIAGTPINVSAMVASIKVQGWTAEELLNQYPSLTLSKIYSALAYYWDHQSDVDAEIENRYQVIEQQPIVDPEIDLIPTKDPLKLLELAGIIADAPCNARDHAEDEVA